MQRVVIRFIAAAIILGGLGATPSLHRDAFDPPLNTTIKLPPQPLFEITWLRGSLRLTGHTLSMQHEEDLRSVAATMYPGSAVATEFVPLGILPDYWADTTVQLVYALAQTVFAQAELTPGSLSIRAVAVDDIGWQNRFAALAASLPATLEVSEDTIIVSAHNNRAATCARAFDAFAAGRINFEESSAVFQNSAYPRLARLAALANACRNAVVAITGHTDSTGTESWNQLLSANRARAVADYLVNSGVARARLRVSGVGSSDPVASNDTRYGRSLNRRIEIGMTATLQ